MAKMYLLAVFCTLLVIASAEFCYNDVEAACSPKQTSNLIDNPAKSSCNSTYGGITHIETDLQAYANVHIEVSFEFLLMSTYFGNYEANRHGFKGLYRKFSDDAWEKAIDLIKYITLRGGKMTFKQLPHFKENIKDSHVLELNEIESLGKALDSQKQLAQEALRIHTKAKLHEDPAVAHYLEEKFMGSQSETVRALSGHVNDLKGMLNRDGPLAIYLFDEYLQKSM